MPFYCFLYVSLALATFLMVMITVQKRFTFSHSEYSVSAAIVLLLLFLPLAVVIKEEFKIFRKKKQSLQTPPPLSVTIETPTPTIPQPPPPEPKLTPTTTSPTKKSSLLSYIIGIFKAPERGEDFSILQAIVSIDMLILFFATISGVGGTLTAIDNMGQLGQSLGYPSRSVGTFVSLVSIWNFAGRVACGFASDIFLTKYKLPRPLMLAAFLLLSSAGHLLIAFGVPGSLYVASVIIGFSLVCLLPPDYIEQQLRYTPCFHVFHQHCIRRWHGGHLPCLPLRILRYFH